MGGANGGVGCGGVCGGGGGGGESLQALYLTLHCHHVNNPALRWTAMRAVSTPSFIVRGEVTRQSANHSFCRDRRTEAGNRTDAVRLPA